MVVLDGKALSILQGSSTMLALFGNRDAHGAYHSLTLNPIDPAGKVRTTLFDFNLDGIPDSRSTYDIASRTVKHETQIAGAWHERIEKDGQYGYMVGSTFYPMKEGKAKILELAAEAQGQEP